MTSPKIVAAGSSNIPMVVKAEKLLPSKKFAPNTPLFRTCKDKNANLAFFITLPDKKGCTAQPGNIRRTPYAANSKYLWLSTPLNFIIGQVPSKVFTRSSNCNIKCTQVVRS